MKNLWWLFAAAAVLDVVAWPWLFGTRSFVKTFPAVLPFAFLFLPAKDLKIFFALALIYLRAVGHINLGVAFLALMAFLYFERWFLTNFFHVTAWQTLVLSSLGIPLFYGAVALLGRIFGVSGLAVSPLLVVSAILSMLLAAGLNFALKSVYKLG